MLAKSIIFSTVLVLAISSIHSVSAQNDVKNTILQKDLMDKVLDLDNELNPTVTATLTGLSLTGASFLMSLARTTNDSESNQIHAIKKHFIKAFFMFLLCTIILFIFDFIEILETHIVLYVILDVIITFTFFGLGVIYLARAAKQLYSTYGK
jgi:fumarate reductase subunit D